MKKTFFFIFKGLCAAPIVEQFLSYSTSKTKKIYYRHTKEKDQIIFSHVSLNNVIFCVLLTSKITIS